MKKSLYDWCIENNRQDLLDEWHSTKNGELKPTDISSGSGKKVWWLGKCGHEWETDIKNRVCGNRCPICANKKVLSGYNDLATTNPALAKEWHPTKNGDLKSTDVSSGIPKKVWWFGECGHEWEATINSRNAGSKCPICANKKVLSGYNDLATINPNLAKEWHPTKNGDLKPTDVSSGSSKKAWWKCSEGHEWEAGVSNRAKGTKCPCCSGRNVISGINDLYTLNPELAKEWHPTKNGDLKPIDVLSSSSKKIWWLCIRGHEWENSINGRAYGRGCPICAIQSQTSFPEQAIFYYLKKIYTDTINRYVDKERGISEIDIFIPSISIGIEYDGLQWHKDSKKM